MRKFSAVVALLTLFPFAQGHADDGFSLTSPDVQAGAVITPAQYWDNFGCTGANERPELSWSGAPEGTMSYAVTLFDQDAPTGSGFWHWVVYNILASVDSIDGTSLPEGALESNTDVGAPGYLGPCPPVGRTHTYTYRVHALDVAQLDAPADATAALTGFFIYQHTLGIAELPVVAGPRSAD